MLQFCTNVTKVLQNCNNSVVNVALKLCNKIVTIRFF